MNLSDPEARNTAFYFPRVVQAEPLHEGQLETFVPCGIIAGIIARTDVQRGVWKAPAGTDAALSGVRGLAVNLTDAENGMLNPRGINFLRLELAHDTGSSAAFVLRGRLPTARQFAWLILEAEEQRTADAQALWERLPQHDELRQVAEQRCQGTTRLRQPQVDAWALWLQACQASPSGALWNCAAWLRRHYAAVHAALRPPWSTGPVEGPLNRLKLIKRSGYGRMQLDRLRQWVLDDAAGHAARNLRKNPTHSINALPSPRSCKEVAWLCTSGSPSGQ
jgi:hypothetical protein